MDLKNLVRKNSLDKIVKAVGIPAFVSGGSGFLHGLTKSAEGSDLDVISPFVMVGLSSFLEYRTSGDGFSGRVAKKITEKYSSYAGGSEENLGSGFGPGPVIATHGGIYITSYVAGRIVGAMGKEFYHKFIS